MAESDPYRPPEAAPDQETDGSPSRVESVAGLASLLLTLFAFLVLIPVEWPLNFGGLIIFTVAYGFGVGLTITAIRAGGLFNWLCATPAAFFQLYMFMALFVL